MVQVYHVEGKELKEISPPYIFLDGDVYVIDNNNEIYIWLGKDSAVDEKGVGAWASHKLDLERRGEPKVLTVVQGEEPDDFKQLISFEVKDGDTPGFLKAAELDIVEFKMYKVEADKQTRSLDDATLKEVPLHRKYLDSDDVFVVDANEMIFVWFGKECNIEERRGGNKLAQKIDVERHRQPVVYYIEEGQGGKIERSFYELLDKIQGKSHQEVSVEDKREQKYAVKEYDTKKQVTKKRGFFSRLFRRGK